LHGKNDLLRILLSQARRKPRSFTLRIQFCKVLLCATPELHPLPLAGRGFLGCGRLVPEPRIELAAFLLLHAIVRAVAPAGMKPAAILALFVKEYLMLALGGWGLGAP